MIVIFPVKVVSRSRMLARPLPHLSIEELKGEAL
jgi:hypothetical protein